MRIQVPGRGPEPRGGKAMMRYCLPCRKETGVELVGYGVTERGIAYELLHCPGGHHQPRTLPLDPPPAPGGPGSAAHLYDGGGGGLRRRCRAPGDEAGPGREGGPGSHDAKGGEAQPHPAEPTAGREVPPHRAKAAPRRLPRRTYRELRPRFGVLRQFGQARVPWGATL